MSNYWLDSVRENIHDSLMDRIERVSPLPNINVSEKLISHISNNGYFFTNVNSKDFNLKLTTKDLNVFFNVDLDIGQVVVLDALIEGEECTLTEECTTRLANKLLEHYNIVDFN